MGPTGPAGPTGPMGSSGGGQFKFGGAVADGESGPIINYLADVGNGNGVDTFPDAIQYPIAVAQSITRFNVFIAPGNDVPVGQKLDVEVLRTGSPLTPPMKVTYGDGNPTSGIQGVTTVPQIFAGGNTPDSLDICCTSTFVPQPDGPVDGPVSSIHGIIVVVG